MPLGARGRAVALVVGLVVLAVVAVGAVVRGAEGAAGREQPEDRGFRLSGPALYFRDAGTGRVAYGDVGGGVSRTGRHRGGPRCDRFHAAAGTAVCLRAAPGLSAPRTHVLVLDRRMREVRRVTVPGVPNRARVSASGRMLSWTVFASGDSYARGGFSTRTGVLDLRTGYLVTSIEQIPLSVDGRRHHAPDVNYWGVTFARDDNRFYATVATKGRTYLVEGDVRKWSAKALRKNVECPSLSPDGTRIAFKKKVSGDAGRPWRLHVLDLRTMRETPLAETRSVDDQAAWLDARTVAYALMGKGTPDVWAVPADGTGKARILVPGGSSPVAVAG
ncbi:hypothetical protein LG634_05035 [Streptomyces bambusae]|nr:hypothetical protein [Streptomyces bambusae]